MASRSQQLSSEPFSFLQFVVLEKHQDPKNGSLPADGTNGAVVDAGLSPSLQLGESVFYLDQKCFPAGWWCQYTPLNPALVRQRQVDF